MTCHRCQTEAFKFGFNPQGAQRYRCKVCRKTFSDLPARILPDMRTDPDKLCQVVHLLCEGVGIRAAERLTRLNRRTILAVLKAGGEQCWRTLDAKVQAVKAEHVEVDEIWAFVYCKQVNAEPFMDHGDQYTFLASDSRSKLIISHVVGKRTHENTYWFIRDLHNRLANRVQLTSDSFDGYKGQGGSPGAIKKVFGNQVDYGTETKLFGNEAASMGERRYSPATCTGVKRRVRIGNPDRRHITTSHAERANLSVRLFNRRLTRLTLGYSKKTENLRHAISMFVAHFNFCRIHSAHNQTPAMAAGLTDHVWTVAELLQPS